MAEKTRYSDEELEEFRQIILEKLDKARKDFELLKSAITQSESNDTQDTSPTFKVLEEGAATLSKEEAGRLRFNKGVLLRCNALGPRVKADAAIFAAPDGQKTALQLEHTAGKSSALDSQAQIHTAIIKTKNPKSSYS